MKRTRKWHKKLTIKEIKHVKDTGLWKYLQGFYGRTVRDLTDAGVIE